ncbi:hypothetical protein EJO66_08995 [Variovorax beijingensis]|uniref:Uncharacterized protein n=1 Tax=Variovorax beijingensis TaxID=2496117 RepID=A0ABY0AB46_9BURK|nr:hypothetical protein [Variovorax beijingensis]RSZ40259.1 hypothetical protein EJO66_08995 [Variovorax beijingensis]
MTSPVDTSVKYFTSQMSGAPALSGTAGSMIALLDACLKDGFDLKTLGSLTVAGGVATAAYTGDHAALPDAVVLISGVTGGPTGWAGMNGEQRVIGKPNANAVTFVTSLPDGAYTGTITMKMAPLGWLKPFSFANGGAYRSADPASFGMFLRVDDAAPTFARVIGYESMSDATTGVGPFPSAAQIAGGGYWPKSANATATAVAWTLVGDTRAFYLFVAVHSSSSSTWSSGWVRGFGDMLPLRPGGDPYACMLNYSNESNSMSMYEGGIDGHTGTALARSASPRDFTGLGSAVRQWVYNYTGASAPMSGADPTLGQFPSKIDGTLKLSRKYLTADGNHPRADIPGLYHQPQTLAFDTFKHLDTAPGTDALAGRTLMALQTGNPNTNTQPNSTNSGCLWVDRTGPWR